MAENAQDRKFDGGTIVGVLILLVGGWLFFKYMQHDVSQGSVPAPAAASNYELWEIKAQESVRSLLKDSGSAEFRGVATRTKSGAPIVCGEVNSKNSFGGYAGFQRFIFAGSAGTFLADHMKPGEMDKVWRELCAG